MSQFTSPPTRIPGALAIEQLNDLVYVFDRQLRFLYVNDAACRILGYTREELLVASAAVIGAEDLGRTGTGIGRGTGIGTGAGAGATATATATAGWSIGDHYTAETSLLSRGGRVIPIEISVRVIEHAGEPVGVVVARDIGERKRLEEKANARLGRFRTLAENSPDCVMHLDAQLRCTYANPAFKQVLGDVPDALLIGQSVESFSVGPVVNRMEVIERLCKVIQDRALQEYEVHLRTPTGERVYLARAVPELDSRGQLVGVISTARDVTPLKRMESELAARAREFHTLVDNLPDVLVRYDLQLRRTYVNPAFHAVHGTTDEAVLGKLPGDGSRLTEAGANALQALLRQTFATKVPCDHEFALPAKDGQIFYWHLRVIPEFDANKAVISLLTVWYEVTDRKHLLASLDRMAYHDALTGIANRALLVDRLTQGLRAAQHRRDALALLFIDLDLFKVVNDRWGHEAGDAVLVAVAHRLQSVVRQADTVARFGGDEFVIVLGETCGAAALTAVMEKVTAAIGEPIIWKGTLLRIGASVGLARYPEDGPDAHSLLQRADESMYFEKARRQSRAGG
jgi:diguanylate cyclase (GGDEF)-like protein/PAS domain S-box-containing protein